MTAKKRLWPIVVLGSVRSNVGVQRRPKAVRWNAGFGCWIDVRNAARQNGHANTDAPGAAALAVCAPRALQVADHEDGERKTRERTERWKPPAAMRGGQARDSVFTVRCFIGFRQGPNV
jgi:hypothetical protein